MQEIDKNTRKDGLSEPLSRMRWMPLVLADMRDYAAERGDQAVARELESCRLRVTSLLEFAEIDPAGKA